MGFFSAIKKIFGTSDTHKDNTTESTDTLECKDNAQSTDTADIIAPVENTDSTEDYALQQDLTHESAQEENASVSPLTTHSEESKLHPLPSHAHEQGQGASIVTEEETATTIEPALLTKDTSAKETSMQDTLAQDTSAHEEAHPYYAQQAAQQEEKTGLSTEAQNQLSIDLRNAQPRLSSWLHVIIGDMEEASELLWQRLHFLLTSLDAPHAEATAFVQDFQAWLARMEYVYVEEFRSELQYRLALALELEDEEDERNRLFVKLSDGLARTREQFTRKLDALFASHGALDAAFWEEMEELFIMADVGFEPSMQLIERLKDGARAKGISEPQGLREVLQSELEDIFRMPKRISTVNPPEVIIMIGVNGVGKTTTIAKLAHRDRMQGKKVLIAAADTFRAAATEQLGVWATRVGADFHCKEAGADPAAVAFEAMDLALQGAYDVLYVDTAGRLQTKTNLMEELKKIRNVIAKKHEGAPHRSILVIDATTGQNALSQTKLFKEAAGVDELILSKLDGTAKGGVAIAVAMQFQVPITYVGLGEKLEDLRPFNGKDFALALLGMDAASDA